MLLWHLFWWVIANVLTSIFWDNPVVESVYFTSRKSNKQKPYHSHTTITMMDLTSKKWLPNNLKAEDFMGFDRMELLGKGCFSSVYKTRYVPEFDNTSISEYKHEDGHIYPPKKRINNDECHKTKLLEGEFAIKVFKRGKFPSNMRRAMFTDEVQVLNRVQEHQNIVSLVCGQHSLEYTVIVFNYYPHNLHQFRNLNESLSLVRIFLFLEQIASALEFCHSKLVIHSDIKPENILVCEGGTSVAIGDFGNASLCDQGDDHIYFQESNPSSRVCTLTYRAPEALLACCYYTEAIDIWAIAVIFIELLFITDFVVEQDEIDAISFVFSQVTEKPDFKQWYSLPQPSLLHYIDPENLLGSRDLVTISSDDDTPTPINQNDCFKITQQCTPIKTPYPKKRHASCDAEDRSEMLFVKKIRDDTNVPATHHAQRQVRFEEHLVELPSLSTKWKSINHGRTNVNDMYELCLSLDHIDMQPMHLISLLDMLKNTGLFDSTIPLMTKCLSPNPQNRPSAGALKKALLFDREALPVYC